MVDGGDAGACGVRERERLTTEVAERAAERTGRVAVKLYFGCGFVGPTHDPSTARPDAP